MRDLPLLHLLGLMIGLALGMLVTVPAIAFAVSSSGLGHGNYLLARLLYPYTMLLSDRVGEISAPLVALAIAQFPLYGATIGTAYPRKWLRIVTFGGVSAAHVIACCLCFGGAS